MASASNTLSSTRSYRDFVSNVMNLDARFERVAKKPGSKKLVCGQWVEVLPEDEDAVSPNRKGSHV